MIIGEALWQKIVQIFVLITGSFLLNIFWTISLNEILINERERFKKLEEKKAKWFVSTRIFCCRLFYVWKNSQWSLNNISKPLRYFIRFFI